MSLKRQKTKRHFDDRLPGQKIFAAVIAGYFLLAAAFYLIAGEQLHYRQSRGNMQLLPANSGTVELVAGSKVEQYFVPKIQIIDSISIQWGTYGRQNTGTVIASLTDTESKATLFSASLDASAIAEGQITQFDINHLEGYYGKTLLISITSPDSVSGSAVSAMMDSAASMENASLYLNGTAVNGFLCVSLSGRDKIWTGLHYWQFVAAGAILLCLGMLSVLYKAKKGRKSLVINAMVAVKKYRYLIRQLISRDFKTKYKRSVLGVFWSFLNPLLIMVVQYVVFSTIFKTNISNYPVYLLIGIVMFNYFSEACGMTLMSILSNAPLITKVYVPKYIYPVSRVLSSAVNLLISLVPLSCLIIFTGTPITAAYLLLLFELVCLIVFCLGLGMLLASSMVFFRDTQFLWSVLSMIWMYATPIFYPESILPQQFIGVLKINPLYYFIKFARICIINGVSPEPIMYVQCALWALGMLAVGAAVFKKTQDKFILYI